MQVAAGWTKVPNSLLETIMRSDLGPRALRVLLYIVRQTAGFHRESVELSYVDISTATNVGTAKLPAVLRELTSRGLIQRTSGNGKKNRFAVLGAAGSAGTTDTARAPTAETARGTSSQTGSAAEADFSNAHAPLPADFSDPKKCLLKESLKRNSLSNVPDAWRRYTATLTEKTRERADLIFEGLRQRFPNDNVEELAACPENLRTFGAPDGKRWTEIKSPHGLMEVAWPQLRDFFRAKTAVKLRCISASSDRAEQSEERDRRLRDEAQEAHFAFDRAFPDEPSRAVALQRFKPTWLSNGLTEPGRSMAIDAWFRSSAQGSKTYRSSSVK